MNSKKRHFRNINLVILTAFICIMCIPKENNTLKNRNTLFQPTKYPDRIILAWDEDLANCRTVTWRTDTSIKNAYAEIAISDGSPGFQKSASRFQAITSVKEIEGHIYSFHSVRLTELHPDMMYIYKVGTEEYWSEWFQFRMPEEKNNEFSFIFLGDAQNDMRMLCSRVMRQSYMENPKADFMLHAGDLINHANNSDEWGEWFYAGGWIFSTIPQLIVPGNHEYYSGSEKSTGYRLSGFWNSSFSLPQNGPDGFEETSYYFDYKNARFIVLNTQRMLISQDDAILQANWLEELLINNNRQWTIVCQHHPIHSARGNRGDYLIKPYLEPLLEKYNVDLVLQGHHHTYARGRNPKKQRNDILSGPIYVVSVSGPKMYDSNFEEWMERLATDVQLYHVIKIIDKKLIFESFLADGILYDSFTIVYQKNGLKYFTERIPKKTKERLEFPSYSYGADVITDEENRKEHQEKAKTYMQKINHRMDK